MITVRVLNMHTKPILAAVVSNLVLRLQRRSAGVPLSKCLATNTETFGMLLSDEFETINAGRTVDQSFIYPSGIDCIDLFSTLNKLKTHVVSK